MNEGIFQIGPIRPPSEANSLLLRVTENCPWNKCKFCMLYKKNDFHTRPVAQVKKDIDTMAEYRDRILQHKKDGEFDMSAVHEEFISLPSDEARMCYQMVFTWLTEGDSQAIFLQDANTMVLRPEWLIEIVSYVRQRLPEIQRITSYGRANTLSRISEEDFKAIRQAGLDRIHSGYESGSDKVLEMICKGATQEEEIIGGRKVKDAGIELSIYFMPGVGGRELSEDNAVETAKVINEVNPDFVRLRTFVLRTGSLMEEVRDSGRYTEATDMEKLLEIRNLISHIDPKRAHGKITSDHIINLLQEVSGYMDQDIPWMLSYIDEYLALPELEQRKYQLARRMGFPLDWKQFYRLREKDQAYIEDLAKNVVDEKAWESMLHKYMDRYI
ncbi:radical SAM protein [Anaerotignum lactatifermentans]|uniref:Radical SAM protein n=1 Tax=Anaerotignum lactatifermentans TaxID=160404 RepID=A0ABS2G7Z0_9FIRM|nr:radical SAM protein [Anaerotignum lactatifermentans]MBM6828835.1 radical SAM protein [Anaerotignum lactatifermentans]MBM6876992.1 radical SAM protein [Anaerotignum lactatifermentans]MBM6950550.1 radical SAM protein [Anaerotignum lactatifermentans]